MGNSWFNGVEGKLYPGKPKHFFLSKTDPCLEYLKMFSRSTFNAESEFGHYLELQDHLERI